MFRKKR